MTLELGWLAESIDLTAFTKSKVSAEAQLIHSAFGRVNGLPPDEGLSFSANVATLIALEALDSQPFTPDTRKRCEDAFSLSRAELQPDSHGLSSRISLLKCLCFGWLADRGPLAAKLTTSLALPVPLSPGMDWQSRVWNQVVDAWVLLFRKRSWSDIEALKSAISALRSTQSEFEASYLNAQESADSAAWELVALYHLAKSADVLSSYLSQGQSDGRFDPRQQLDAHFDRAVSAAKKSSSSDALEVAQLLHFASNQMVENSLWTISRAAGPDVRRFVESLTRYERPLLEVLAPQREALGKNGLARAAQRSAVVSLPTSSGKTLIAEFRIVQSLSLFRVAGGFVAYVAPTRALVNQVARRLRHDLAPLGINVEKVSPALEVDGVEAELLSDANTETRFDVLVTTPEKLDLLIRGSWIARTERPLSLVVVDEAHNISESNRGLKLELMLATINRELRDSQFLLLTPFIENAKQVASWLDPASNQSVQLELNWQPNDRVISLARRLKGGRRGDCSLEIQSVATSRGTLTMEPPVEFAKNRPLQLSYTEAASPNKWAAAVSSELSYRGATITLAQQPRYAWGIAHRLADEREPDTLMSRNMTAILEVIREELGSSFPLHNLLRRKIGVHHSGLPDEVRQLTEWLLENDEIDHLVATTTIAQGVNFPVANIVFATHQYPYGESMPPSDFWNIAGRAGRVDQGQVGVIAMAAPTVERETVLRRFIGENVGALNSTLLSMVKDAITEFGSLDLKRLTMRDNWSAFSQYLAHSYRQIDDHDLFVAETEQVLRGTFGFQSLRDEEPHLAAELVKSVHQYAQGLYGKQLSLVDATGFSWESVAASLGRLSEQRIDAETWESPIFSRDREPLRKMIGIMLEVPELRENLLEGSSEARDRSSYLANIIHDWVNGSSLEDIATHYFSKANRSVEDSVSTCCQRLFGKIAPTVSWGLSAIQAMTLRGQNQSESDDNLRGLRNLPSFAYYGVSNEQAVALRLLNVPRTAADKLSQLPDLVQTQPTDAAGIASARQWVRTSTESHWTRALGAQGANYHRVWQILDGRL